MSKVDIILVIHYDHENLTYKIKGNTQNPKDFVTEFLRTQMGQGIDFSAPNMDISNYKIELGLKLEDDTFFTSHNCGSKALRDGILIQFVEPETEFTEI